jgi:Dynamin family
MVLCVGNHSSGKSSFINYVLGRNVQTAGVAPTDDCFTIIAPSDVIHPNPDATNSDYDQDGFAIIGNPDYGFTSLRQFGPTLQHHTVFKLRSNINSNFIIGQYNCLCRSLLFIAFINFVQLTCPLSLFIFDMVVDSPGMIDAPSNYASSGLSNNSGVNISNRFAPGSNNGSNIMDRGYDFAGVVKWYADRADVVLLFFDPDKPGTTGETLSILVNALSNIDHKLFIIFNKADRFMNQQIHDFARAYGSLCWNLSKVIPRKDLPRIYTMCLPVTSTATSSTSNGNTVSDVAEPIPPGLQDLYDAREEVVAQVRKAPERRLDNVITNLYDSISLLHMYARIIQDLQQRYYRNYWKGKYQELFFFGFGIASTVGCATYGVTALGFPNYSTALCGSVTLLSSASIYWYNSYNLKLWEYQNCTSTELYNTFTRLYAYDIMNGNENTAHTWTQIRDQLSITLQPSSKSSHSVHLRSDGDDGGNIKKLSIVSDRDLQKLHGILFDEIPRLRRLVSPPTSNNTTIAESQR